MVFRTLGGCPSCPLSTPTACTWTYTDLVITTVQYLSSQFERSCSNSTTPLQSAPGSLGLPSAAAQGFPYGGLHVCGTTSALQLVSQNALLAEFWARSQKTTCLAGLEPFNLTPACQFQNEQSLVLEP